MKFNPKPGDTIHTEDGTIYICCTQKHLRDTYELATWELQDEIFGFRPDASNPLGVSWNRWPSSGESSFDLGITKVITAPCNRSKFKGNVSRHDLIDYLQTLSTDTINITEDGTINEY